jgi:hypothetical protein
LLGNLIIKQCGVVRVDADRSKDVVVFFGQPYRPFQSTTAWIAGANS